MTYLELAKDFDLSVQNRRELVEKKKLESFEEIKSLLFKLGYVKDGVYSFTDKLLGREHYNDIFINIDNGKIATLYSVEDRGRKIPMQLTEAFKNTEGFVKKSCDKNFEKFINKNAKTNSISSWDKIDGKFSLIGNYDENYFLLNSTPEIFLEKSSIRAAYHEVYTKRENYNNILETEVDDSLVGNIIESRTNQYVINSKNLAGVIGAKNSNSFQSVTSYGELYENLKEELLDCDESYNGQPLTFGYIIENNDEEVERN